MAVVLGEGLLIKLALATETEQLDDLDERFRRADYYDPFGGSEDFMPPLLADLRAMVEQRAA